MRVHVVEEFSDLRGPALGVALEALGHELTSDAGSAEVLLCRDPPSIDLVGRAEAAGATVATHAEFLMETPRGAALLRFAELLSPVLDGEEGIGCGIDEPLTDADADDAAVLAMLAILALRLPVKRPLGLGFQLVRAAEELRDQEKYALALRALEVAFDCGDDIRVWARGGATGAFSLALWLLHPENTGIPLDAGRARWFLERCLPGGATDLLVHLEAARLYAALKDDGAACAELERFLQRGAFFLAAIESDARLERIRMAPSTKAAIAAARASLPKDPEGFLEPLLQNREACAQLYPAPVPRSQPSGAAQALPAWLQARVRFGKQLSGGDDAVHGEGEYEARSRVTHLARRSTWIVDLLNGIPKLPAIAAEYGAHAAEGHELDLVWNRPELDSMADGLYWLWHLYFSGEDALLGRLLPRAASSPAKYLRDAAELVGAALERPTRVGHVDLGKQREAFIEKLGKSRRTLAPVRAASTPPSEQACDRDALLTALKAKQASFAAFPSDEGKVTAAGIEALIADMPDTLGDYFAGVERPDMPAAGGVEFALACLIRQTLASPLPSTTHTEELDLEGEDVTVYYGDLEVSGALSFEGLVIVLGNLVVDGVLEDSDDFAHLWVTGSLHARAINCKFTGWIGETVEASAIVMGRRGSLFAVEGTDTPLAIRQSDEGHGFRGMLRATHHFDVAADDTILTRVIAKKFLEVDDDFVSLDADALLSAVAKGKRVLAG